MRTFLTLALLALPFLPATAAGGDCGVATIMLGEVEIGDGTAAHTFYLDDRNYLLGDGDYVYQESNGVYTPHAATDDALWVVEGTGPWANLQRGGTSAIVPNDTDPCHDDSLSGPDTLIF